MSEAEKSITIRDAVPADAARLTEIAFAAKRHWGYPESWLQQWRETLTIAPERMAEMAVFGAINESSVVAFCGVKFEDGDAWIEHLWVLPEWMGQGIGRRLFERAESLARARGMRALAIESDPHAEPFYLRMGARVIGRKTASMEGVERFLPVMRKPL